MHTLAKRIHNITPRSMVLTFADETTRRMEISSAEFFQEAFQAEGESDGTRYRFVSDGDEDPLVAARETDDGWEPVGEVTAVERVES
ncbi:hypothetical protein [Halosegnis rubeus]|jgi:hypothetical protein|uniref:DUF8072 domain-containing protein n=1 Tax=Halosegnis rubeus TaxID=2212850 RepID=A0A5N5UKR7_9EURY|nr:hypothetical protein [Halosegnis rubeus]KAB7518870.1 hypothetical protein DP108_06825 [Halosegnis rubeus]